MTPIERFSLWFHLIFSFANLRKPLRKALKGKGVVSFVTSRYGKMEGSITYTVA